MSEYKDKILNEDLTTPAEPNIATADENLSIEQIFHQTLLPSLGRQIFSVVPLHGPTGGIFNIRKKAGSDELELVRSNVEVYNSESIKTGITREAIQDLYSQFGKNAYDLVAVLLRGLANDQENTQTLSFLDTQAKAAVDLTLTDPTNAEVNLFQIVQKVQELVLIMNNLNLRTYEAFAVLPANVLGGVMGLTNYIGADDKDYRGLFIAKINQTKFYLNPDATSTTAYVGLRDSYNASRSSAIFSPYEDSLIESLDPDTGSPVFFIFNRFAITASPLHVLDNEMLYKFDIV